MKYNIGNFGQLVFRKDSSLMLDTYLRGIMRKAKQAQCTAPLP